MNGNYMVMAPQCKIQTPIQWKQNPSQPNEDSKKKQKAPLQLFCSSRHQNLIAYFFQDLKWKEKFVMSQQQQQSSRSKKEEERGTKKFDRISLFQWRTLSGTFQSKWCLFFTPLSWRLRQFSQTLFYSTAHELCIPYLFKLDWWLAGSPLLQCVDI